MSKEIVGTTYRSIQENGGVWCESTDLEEVKTMSRGKKVTYVKQVELRIIQDWKAMTDEEVFGPGVIL